MSKKTAVIVFILLGILIVALTVVSVVLILERDGTIEALENEGNVLSTNLNDLKSQKSRLEGEVAKLNTQISELNTLISDLQGELEDTKENLSDSGAYFAGEIAALQAEVAAKKLAISELEADIARYETVYNIDVLAQANLIDEIIKYIESNPPYVRIPAPPEIDEETGEIIPPEPDAEQEYVWANVNELVDAEIALIEEIGEEAEPLFTPEELAASKLSEEELTRSILRERILAREDIIYPSVSVYYEDLTTGYHFEYAADKVYPAASVIKAPYILALLQAVAADEEAYFAALEEAGESPEMIDTDEDGEPDTVVIEYSDPKFVLTDVVVYDSETMIKEGSGKIKDMPDGSEFTYIDFIKYALEFSDNVAYQQLKNRFKYDYYYPLARSVGAKVTAQNANKMSAADAGKLFEAIYEFINENETYGTLMRESMQKGNHPVLIPYAVHPTNTLHKYGWDKESYHDAAIVEWNDKPYVIAIFSDLDMGGNDVNIYLRDIIKMVNQLHRGFYKN